MTTSNLSLLSPTELRLLEIIIQHPGLDHKELRALIGDTTDLVMTCLWNLRSLRLIHWEPELPGCTVATCDFIPADQL